MSDAVEVASSDTPAAVEPIPEPTSVEFESESPTLPKAAQAVYSNDLIMSLVYRFITDRKDLARCLLVSKEGYDTAANELFAKTSTKAMSRLFDEGCSFVSLSRCLPSFSVVYRTLSSAGYRNVLRKSLLG